MLVIFMRTRIVFSTHQRTSQGRKREKRHCSKGNSTLSKDEMTCDSSSCRRRDQMMKLRVLEMQLLVMEHGYSMCVGGCILW